MLLVARASLAAIGSMSFLFFVEWATRYRDFEFNQFFREPSVSIPLTFFLIVLLLIWVPAFWLLWKSRMYSSWPNATRFHHRRWVGR